MPISTIGSNSLNQTSDLTINGQTVGKGGGNVATNTVHGAGALAANTSGAFNVAVGRNALTTNTTGSDNIAIGDGSQLGTTTGVKNVSAGSGTLYANTTGSYNVAMGAPEATNGYAALRFNTTGSYNTALGSGSLGSNTTASNNTAVGYQAGYNNTTNGSNTYLGYQSGYNVTTGGSNIFIGSAAGAYTTPITTGSQNIMIGFAGGSSASVSNEIVIATSVSAGKGGNTGFINPGGGSVYQGNNSGTWSQVSDRRLKKNIVDNTDGLDKITALQIRNFEYRLPEEVTELDPSCAIPNTGVQLGVIAQEIQEVFPDCVKTESTGVISVDSDNLTWYMINAIKDLKTIVDAQAAEIAELKAKVA